MNAAVRLAKNVQLNGGVAYGLNGVAYGLNEDLAWRVRSPRRLVDTERSTPG
jgi:hypothetical protein